MLIWTALLLACRAPADDDDVNDQQPATTCAGELTHPDGSADPCGGVALTSASADAVDVQIQADGIDVTLDDLCGPGEVFWQGGLDLTVSGDEVQAAVAQVRRFERGSTTVTIDLDLTATASGGPIRASLTATLPLPTLDPSSFYACTDRREVSTVLPTDGDQVPLDVLLIMDDSCSQEEHGKLMQAFDLMMDGVLARLPDWRIGATYDNEPSQFYANDVTVITPEDADPIAVLTAASDEHSGPTDTAPLTALGLLLGPILQGRSTPLSALLRDDAALAVIVLSDEDQEVAPVADRRRAIELLSAFKPGQTSFHTITSPPDERCATAQLAPTLHAVREAIGGNAIDICGSHLDYARVLDGVERTVGRTLRLTPSPAPGSVRLSRAVGDGWEPVPADQFDVSNATLRLPPNLAEDALSLSWSALR